MPHRRALVLSVMITLLLAVATVAAADRYLGSEDPPTPAPASATQAPVAGQADNAPLLDLLNGITGENGDTSGSGTGAYIDDEDHEDHDSERDHDDAHDD